MGAHRTYTDQEKGIALAYYDASGHNESETARKCKVPRQTLQAWVRARHISADVPKIRQVKKGELADRLEDLAQLLVDVMPDKLEESQLPAVATALGITVDKMRLLRGQPTAINDLQGLKIDFSGVTLEQLRAATWSAEPDAAGGSEEAPA